MNMINTCISSTEAPPREQSSACKYFNFWRICCISLDIKSRLACKINNKDCDMEFDQAEFPHLPRAKNGTRTWSYKESWKLTTGLFWILRARFAYLRVLRVSSALTSAGLMQAGKGESVCNWKACRNFSFHQAKNIVFSVDWTRGKTRICLNINICNYESSFSSSYLSWQFCCFHQVNPANK